MGYLRQDSNDGVTYDDNATFRRSPNECIAEFERRTDAIPDAGEPSPEIGFARIAKMRSRWGDRGTSTKIRKS